MTFKAVIVESEEVQGVVWYTLHVQDNERSWQVRKRFREFEALDDELESIGSMRRELPPKSIFGVRRSLRGQFMVDRKKQLNYYLDHQAQQISALDQNPTLCKFLQSQDSASQISDRGPPEDLMDLMNAAMMSAQAASQSTGQDLVSFLDGDLPAEADDMFCETRDPGRDTARASLVALPEGPKSRPRRVSFGGAPAQSHRRPSWHGLPFLGVRPLGRLQSDALRRLQRLIRDGDVHGAQRTVERCRKLDVDGRDLEEAEAQIKVLAAEGELKLLMPKQAEGG